MKRLHLVLVWLCTFEPPIKTHICFSAFADPKILLLSALCWRLLYLVVTSFFPRSFALVKRIVLAYLAALIFPCGRRTGDALCALSSALVGRYWNPLAGHRFCTRHASHPSMGGHLSLGGAGQRHRAQFRYTVPEKIPAWSTARTHPRLVGARVA